MSDYKEKFSVMLLNRVQEDIELIAKDNLWSIDETINRLLNMSIKDLKDE